MPGLAHFLKNTLIIVISREEIKRDQNWPILKHVLAYHFNTLTDFFLKCNINIAEEKK